MRKNFHKMSFHFLVKNSNIETIKNLQELGRKLKKEWVKMRRRYLFPFYISVAALLMISCQSVPVKQKNETKKEAHVWKENPRFAEEEKEQEQKTFNNSEMQMYINSIERSEPLNLTEEEKLEDYDFMWNLMQEKVYCLEELAAERGINLKQHIADHRGKVGKTKDDAAFYEAMQDSVAMFRGIWHIGLNSPYTSLSSAVLYSDTNYNMRLIFTEENKRKLKYWDTALMQSHSPGYESDRSAESAGGEFPTLKIMNDKAAVIKVPTMRFLAAEEEAAKVLIDLMKKVSDYENVIFDLKGNSGGNTLFADENIIAPNIDEKTDQTILEFFKDAGDIHQLNNFELKEPIEWKKGYGGQKVYPAAPLSELPEELRIPEGEYGNADYYNRFDKSIYPRYDRKILNGKLWVLTYPENYSAAEAFVAFCKATGFATLVGEQTGGDGIGGMSYWYALPNSGLTAVTGYAWGLNQDGTNNSNEGTKPDIQSPENETALETCLKIINKEEEN